MKNKYIISLLACTLLATGCTIPPSYMYHQSKPYMSREDFDKGFTLNPGDTHVWKDVEITGKVACIPSKDSTIAGCIDGLETPDGKYYDLDLDTLNASARLPATTGDTITLIGKVNNDGTATSRLNIAGTIKVWATK